MKRRKKREEKCQRLINIVNTSRFSSCMLFKIKERMSMHLSYSLENDDDKSDGFLVFAVDDA